MDKVRIGIIGGSGLYQMTDLKNIKEINIQTPFGSPSESYIVGDLQGQRVAFLARHGRGHRINPTNLPARANIYGFKMMGVEMIISVGACGSMKEKYKPTDIVIIDQFIDRTRHRPDTFFDEGIVVHISFADPICHNLSDILYKAATEAGAVVHKGGTYLNMEGPQFSTRAESHLYRSWGVDVIGMTNLTEAKLAREAEICYATMAMVTDYDCWYEGEEDVTVEMLIATLNKNATVAQKSICNAVKLIGDKDIDCPCRHALAISIITQKEMIPEETRKKLSIILDKYLK